MIRPSVRLGGLYRHDIGLNQPRGSPSHRIAADLVPGKAGSYMRSATRSLALRLRGFSLVSASDGVMTFLFTSLRVGV